MNRLPLVVLCAALGLLVSCGKGGSAPSPVAPETPNIPVLRGSNPSDPGVRSSTNVTEGEVVLSGTGTEILELPVSANGFAVLQLTAEPVDGGADPSLEATARIAQPIGGFSIAPVGAYSSYGIPQTREPRTFSRHFVEDGLMRVELTNELPGETTGDGGVRWRYRMSEAPDPLTVETETYFGEFTATPLELGVVHQDTLVRGVRERGWTMRRPFSVQLQEGAAYRFEVRPLVSDPAWTWRITTDKVGVASQALMKLDGVWDQPTSIDWVAIGGGPALFNVWVQAPHEVSGLQAATFEVLVHEIALAPPAVTAVLPELIWDRYGSSNAASKWSYAPDGTPKGIEGSRARVRIYGSGCPCTITLDPEPRPFHLGSNQTQWETKRSIFRLGEAGDQELLITLHNAAGDSEPYPFRYRAEPGQPRVYLDGEWDLGQNKLTVPVMESVTIPMVAQFRTEGLQIDYGPHANPRYATDPSEPVFFLQSGGQTVRVTTTNEMGTLTSNLEIGVGSHQFSPFEILQIPIVAGVPTRLAARHHSEDATPSWHFWNDGLPTEVTGLSAFATFAQAGWHDASLSMANQGDLQAQGFRFVVNPAGTSILPGHPMQGFSSDEQVISTVRYQGGVLCAIYTSSNGHVSFRQWDTEGNYTYPFNGVQRPWGAGTARPAAELVLWRGVPHFAVAYQNDPMRLFRLTDVGNVPLTLSAAFVPATSEFANHTGALSLLVREDVLILSAGQYGSYGSKQFLVAAMPWGEPVASDSSIRLSSGQDATTIRTLATPEGLLTLLGEYSDAMVIRTPMADAEQLGDHELGAWTSLAPGAELDAYSFIRSGDRYYLLARNMTSQANELPYSLDSLTWDDALDSDGWTHHPLPHFAELESLTDHRLAAVQGEVHVVATYKGHDRVLEFTRDSATGTWITQDRIDTIGKTFLADTIPSDTDLILVTGSLSGMTYRQSLFVNAY